MGGGINLFSPGFGLLGVPRGRNTLLAVGNLVSVRTVCLRARGNGIGAISEGYFDFRPPGPRPGATRDRARGPGPEIEIPPEIGPITLPRALKHTVRKGITFPSGSRVLRPRGTPKRPNPGKNF